MSNRKVYLRAGTFCVSQSERGIEGQEQFVSNRKVYLRAGTFCVSQSERGIEGQEQFVSNGKLGMKGRNNFCQSERGIEGQEQFVSVKPKGVSTGRNSLCQSNRKGYRRAGMLPEQNLGSPRRTVETPCGRF